MSAPENKNPFPKTLAVRLAVYTEGDFMRVECEMCHKILVSGDEISLGNPLAFFLVQVVNNHVHEV